MNNRELVRTKCFDIMVAFGTAKTAAFIESGLEDDFAPLAHLLTLKPSPNSPRLKQTGNALADIKAVGYE